MGFILKDKQFAIRSAELSATIPDPCWVRKYDPARDPRPYWSLEVWVEGDLGIEEEARATAEEMRFQIRRWTDIVGQTVEWTAPSDKKAGRPYGLPYGNFYLGEHDIISRARLRFTERDGVQFKFEWEGACNVYLDDEDRRDVTFSAEGWARFSGVGVLGSAADTDESLRSRLAWYFDPHDLVQGPLIRREYRRDFFRRYKFSEAIFTPSEAHAA
ncbi:MAG TPA: hypothetical protein VGW12_17595 [Pyrinomonadaceae bacterium]|nr:hypothetical protein [Pyrinomonadaceae bacterium]